LTVHENAANLLMKENRAIVNRTQSIDHPIDHKTASLQDQSKSSMLSLFPILYFH